VTPLAGPFRVLTAMRSVEPLRLRRPAPGGAAGVAQGAAGIGGGTCAVRGPGDRLSAKLQATCCRTAAWTPSTPTWPRPRRRPAQLLPAVAVPKTSASAGSADVATRPRRSSLRRQGSTSFSGSRCRSRASGEHALPGDQALRMGIPRHPTGDVCRSCSRAVQLGWPARRRGPIERYAPWSSWPGLGAGPLGQSSTVIAARTGDACLSPERDREHLHRLRAWSTP